jgi:ferredoxin-nitrite reductase
MEELFEAKLKEKIEQQKEWYQKEIVDFQEIGHKFIRGEINSNEFKASSGGMGVYAQRGGKEFMIRLRVLSGVLDFKTLELINEFVKDYDLPDVHLTTREAIQLHNLKFDDVISIMERSLHSNLFTRGGGGNFPRNVSLSPLSGVERGEAFDVTSYAVLVNKYFVSRMNSYRLPRKFKVAFSNNQNDTANATIADLGFLAINQEEKNYFKVYIGGSLGNNGDISVPFDELVPTQDILYHVEACLRLLTEEGDYENKGKARMRFIVKRMGRDEFLNCYKKILQQIKTSKNLDLVLENEQLSPTQIENKDVFHEHSNLVPQKQGGLYTVIIHPKGGILKKEDLNHITAFLQGIEESQIRLSMEENMYIRNLTLNQAENLLSLSKNFRQTTRLEQSISCIGVPTCQIGIGESQKLLSHILTYFENQGMKDDILPSIHISGCLNSCSRHQVSEIGFHCKKKQVSEQTEEVYTLHIGGMASEFDTHFAKEYGEIVASLVPQFLYELALCLKEKHLEIKEYMKLYTQEFESILVKYLK